MLATYLAETATTDIVLTHFFRDSVDRHSARAASLAAALLTKLCQYERLVEYTCFSRVIVELLPLCAYFDSGRECPLTKLLDVLDILFDCLPACTLVVDALDECTDPDESDLLLKYLRRLGSRPHARVILLSRKHARFEEFFKHTFQVPMDPFTVEPDITYFLRQEIGRSPRLQALEKDILKKASTDCQGMFLWAKLMLDYLKTAHSINAQRRRIARFPPGLFAVYEQQLEENSANLDHDEMVLRHEVFLLLVGAVEPLTVQDISAALALNCASDLIDENDLLLDPTDEVLKLCWPLAMVVNEQAQLIHLSVKEFLLQRQGGQRSTDPEKLHMSLEDSNAFLARKSLSKLTQNEYRFWKCSASLLRKHLLAGNIIEHTFKESVFYEYACLHWHEHVTALSHPSDTILTKLSQFLTGNEFVTWSEVLFELKRRSGLGAQVQVRAALQSWYELLPPKTRERVPISAYFITSHESLNKELVNEGGDKLLPYLPLVRLGEYFNLGAESRGDWQTAYNYKKTVAEGYEELLGGRNPITLRARTTLLQEYFWQTRFDEAERDLLEVSTIQREVLGEDVVDYSLTLQLLGLAQFYLNKFGAACSTLAQSGEGLRKMLGRSHPRFLMTELYNGYALEVQAKLDRAYRLYEDIWEQWVPIMGAEHPLSLMVQTAMGSIHRKRKEYVQAEKAFLESWAARQRLFTIGNNVSVDSAIQLAILYREVGRSEEAVALLDLISTSSVFPSDFERVCQVRHIRALMDFDAGEYNMPKSSLQHLLDEATGTNRDRNNRELLWVRITLSDVLRQHGKFDEASMLFSDLVEPDEDDDDGGTPTSPSSLDDEPQPPIQLAIAEQALRYLKQAKQTASEKILEENGLRWVRKRDFWIMQGGPIADTAWMDGPKPSK